MFQIFSNENLDEVLAKKPTILYYAEPGACGKPGLMIVVFSDHSVYGYNTSLSNDKDFLVSLVNSVPELKSLVHLHPDEGYAPKRESIVHTLVDIYLGLGNCALVSEDIDKEINRYFNEKKGFILGAFAKTLEKETGMKINEMVVDESKMNQNSNKYGR